MSVQEIEDSLDYFGEEVDTLRSDFTIYEEEDAKVVDLSDLEEELAIQAEDQDPQGDTMKGLVR